MGPFLRRVRIAARASALLALFLALSVRAFGQSSSVRVKVLGTPTTEMPALFAELVRVHVGRAVGNRIPDVHEAQALEPAVYVTLTVDSAWVWDAPVVRLERGQFPRGSLATCPGLCSVALRDATVRALSDQVANLHAASLEPVARALIIADGELPYDTLLVALRSVASATLGGPPALALAVRAPNGIGALPIHIPPPTPLLTRAVGNPQLFEVSLSKGGWEVRAEPYYIPTPTQLADPERLLGFMGALKSRDPHRLVAFVSAPARSAVKFVARTADLVRREYPVIVLKAQGPMPVRIAAPPK